MTPPGVRADLITIDLDAHAWPFDGLPECEGSTICNPSMVEVAERFGVLMADVTQEGWGPLRYRITGPPANVRRAVAEYWGTDDLDDVMGAP